MKTNNHLIYWTKLIPPLLIFSLFLASCGSEEPGKQDAPKAAPTSALPPPPAKEENIVPIKILSLDGGGIRGIIVAHILAAIEKETGKKTTELFDVFSGTSTGGLLAIILNSPLRGGPPMSASAAEQFYISKGKDIFKYNCSRFTPKSACQLQGPLYDITSMENLISGLYGTQLFKLALKPLAITTFAIETKQGMSLDSDSEQFSNLTLLEVGRATSAAPTYFAPKEVSLKGSDGTFSQTFLVDGGLYKNNPSQIGYKKAVDIFGDEVKKRGLILISIGTGVPVRNQHDGESMMKASAIKWAPTIIDAMMAGTSTADEKIMEDIFATLPPSSRYIRIQSSLNNYDYPRIGEMDNIEPQNMSLLQQAAEATMKGDAYKEALRLISQ